jgi:hypothetical protein
VLRRPAGRGATRIFEDNAESIGNTPLERLNRIAKGEKAAIRARVEGRNPVAWRFEMTLVRGPLRP